MFLTIMKNDLKQCLVRQRENTKVRNDYITDLIRLDINERWKHFSLDRNHRIDYYPSEWTNENVQDLKSVSPEILELMTDRLSECKRKGPWKEFYRKVQSVFQEDAE